MQNEVNAAAEIIKNGGVIAYPTDTIWGLGCDATNPVAIAKIVEIKGRSANKSFIILLDNDNKLYDYVTEVPPFAHELIEYSEKPLTIIYPKAKNLPKEIIAEDGSIAIRVTNDEFCKRLIQKTGKPIISTSANKSGQASPGNFTDIDETILSNADYVVNLRREERSLNTPSTIIKLQLNGTFEFIRK